MGGHGLDHTFGFANGAGHFKGDIRKASTQLVDDQRQIILEMSALSDEHRHDDDAIETFSNRRRRAVLKARRQEFEKGKFDSQTRRAVEDRCTNTTKRRCPFWISGTMSKEDQGGCWHGVYLKISRDRLIRIVEKAVP